MDKYNLKQIFVCVSYDHIKIFSGVCKHDVPISQHFLLSFFLYLDDTNVIFLCYHQIVAPYVDHSLKSLSIKEMGYCTVQNLTCDLSVSQRELIIVALLKKSQCYKFH